MGESEDFWLTVVTHCGFYVMSEVFHRGGMAKLLLFIFQPCSYIHYSSKYVSRVCHDHFSKTCSPQSFTSVTEVLESFGRRVLCYPLYRHFSLVTCALNDIVVILQLGKYFSFCYAICIALAYNNLLEMGSVMSM